MAQARDPWEFIVSTQKSGIYESNYLKGNSPDGNRGFWIKHNLLSAHETPDAGNAAAHLMGEFWVILFRRGHPPIVGKKLVPHTSLRLSNTNISIDTQKIHLQPTKATGTIGCIRWDLSLTEGGPPLLHLPWDWMYRAGFPKKKLVTPHPNARFNGRIQWGDQTWELDNWIGMRGHNWGTEHAHQYAYGNCNLWDDGVDRVVDGFTAQVKLGPVKSPWLSSLVARNPNIAQNQLRHWFRAGQVSPGQWRLGWPSPSSSDQNATVLTMSTDPTTYVGLRYEHPDGSESYCYNTKFADVEWRAQGERFTSKCGELEVLFPDPLADVPMHPTKEWDPGAGDYLSL